MNRSEKDVFQLMDELLMKKIPKDLLCNLERDLHTLFIRETIDNYNYDKKMRKNISWQPETTEERMSLYINIAKPRKMNAENIKESFPIKGLKIA